MLRVTTLGSPNDACLERMELSAVFNPLNERSAYAQQHSETHHPQEMENIGTTNFCFKAQPIHHEIIVTFF